MDRSTPVRKPHTSTADLLVWSETPQSDYPAQASTRRSSARAPPSDGISKVVFGGQVTDEEVESLNRRKPCSGYKTKEMTGSGIFERENDESQSDGVNPIPNSRTGLRMYQQAIGGISHISFGEEESVSTKKPATLSEVAKQRELSGSLESEYEAKLQKQGSDAKCKELSGHDIFAPPPEILPRPAVRALALKENFNLGEFAPRDVQTSVKASNTAGDQSSITSSEEPVNKTAKKIYDKKFSELSGYDVFKGEAPPSFAEKPLSDAKLREMSGSNIFADGKAESRDHLGGVRKPPGGESSIALV